MQLVAEGGATFGERRTVASLRTLVSGPIAPLLPIVVGTALRFGFAAYAPLAPQWDGEIYVRGADLLAAGETYSQRILDPAAPDTATAFYPVGLSAVLALVRMSGGGLREDLLLQATAGSLSIVLLAWLAKRLVGERLAHRATWIYALAPGPIMLTGTWLAEPLVTLGLMVALAVFLRLSARRPVLAAASLGALLGLTSYLRATPLAIAPFVAFGLGLGVGIGRARGLRRGIQLAMVAAAASILPLAPWAMRNADALGAPVLISTNGGVNLLIGTVGDGSYQDIARPARCAADGQEVALDRCRGAVATERIVHHPIAWVIRGVSKLWHTFGHDSAPAQHLALAMRGEGARGVDPWLLLGLCRMHWTSMFAFAVFGAIARSRRPIRRGHAILFGPLIGLALLHFIYIGGDRYHAPVAPLLAILAAEATAYVGARRKPLAIEPARSRA